MLINVSACNTESRKGPEDRTTAPSYVRKSVGSVHKWQRVPDTGRLLSPWHHEAPLSVSELLETWNLCLLLLPVSAPVERSAESTKVKVYRMIQCLSTTTCILLFLPAILLSLLPEESLVSANKIHIHT